MIPIERKEKIIELLQVHYALSVIELKKKLNVSEATIRRDLVELEQSGEIKRAHGGAVLNNSGQKEQAYSEKVITMLEEKKEIAEVAAEYINDDETIILDSGSTTIQLLPYLYKKRLTIVTNSIVAAYELSSYENIELIVTGGQNRDITRALVGDIAFNALNYIHVNKVFLGANAINLKTGLTTPNLDEAKIKRKMAEVADEVFVLVDNSKFNKASFAKIIDVYETDYIITDSKISNTHIKSYTENSIKIIKGRW